MLTALRVQLGRKALQAQRGLQVFKALLDLPDLQVQLDQRVQHQLLLAQQALQVQQVQVGQTASLAPPDQLGLQGLLELRAYKASRVQQGLPDLQAHKVFKVLLAQQVQLDQQGQPELVVLLDPLAQQALVTLA